MSPALFYLFIQETTNASSVAWICARVTRVIYTSRIASYTDCAMGIIVCCCCSSRQRTVTKTIAHSFYTANVNKPSMSSFALTVSAIVICPFQRLCMNCFFFLAASKIFCISNRWQMKKTCFFSQREHGLCSRILSMVVVEMRIERKSE